MSKENYFDPEYVSSRKKIAREYREFAERELPKPQSDWGTIWPLSGPEHSLDTNPTVGDKESQRVTSHNQTKDRFETALNIARMVTATRLNIDVVDITLADIQRAGPVIYWNGVPSQNEYLTQFVADGNMERRYNFPAEKVIVSTDSSIHHTNDQFEDFTKRERPQDEKIVIVTDLYHWPRIERYVKKHSKALPPENVIIYPSQPSRLPVKLAMQEIKKIHGYSKDGILPPDDDAPDSPTE